ncbi:MAG: hypothetical protein SW019_18995 [Actinomycetota bacterium]|nr:hypothetical protein [Actinomycetota bacterium]
MLDPGQNLWIFGLRSLIPKSQWPSITHIVITHSDPCHYSVPFFWKRRCAVADAQRFKREVELLGVECTILGYGQAVVV